VVQEIRALLTARKLLLAKPRDIESSIRGILRGIGLKVGTVSEGKFEARIGEFVAGQAGLERVAEPPLRARAALRAEYTILHGELLKVVRMDEVCRRRMTSPARLTAPTGSARSAMPRCARRCSRRPT
jgi:transposase